MLSIIISSYQEHYYKELQENIKDTIGEDFIYEVIKIENPGLMGICEAYNQGAEKASYDYLLFIHEDVLFQSTDWGKKLSNHFSTLNDAGVLAVAGTSYKSLLPVGWWSFTEYSSLHIDQITKQKETHSHRLTEPKKVIITDGVFLAMTKKIWSEFRFNAQNTDFHGYDIEMSLDVSKKYQNYVIHDVLITHLSSGNINKNWLDRLIKIYSHHRFLPKNFSRANELSAYEIFFRYLNRFKYTRAEKVKVFFTFYRPRLFSLKENLKILNMFIYYFNPNH